MKFNHYSELVTYAKSVGKHNSLEFFVLGKNMSMMKFIFLDAYFGFVRAYDQDGVLQEGFFRISELQDLVLYYFISEEDAYSEISEQY